MKRVVNILLVLALITAAFVSCSQEVANENNFDSSLVAVSFTPKNGSKALTVSREAFDENNYVWFYTAQKADSTGLNHGEKSERTPVRSNLATGLTGAIIDDLSQGYWNFNLYAYVPMTGDVTADTYRTSGVIAWAGSVENQVVQKGQSNIVSVIVSAQIVGKGYIVISKDITMKLLETGSYGFADIIEKGMKFSITVSNTDGTEPETRVYTSFNPESWNEKFTKEAGTYLVTVKVYDDTFTYATETIAVNVYSGLSVVISGFVSELSSYVEFGEPSANPVVEATANVNIKVPTEVVFEAPTEEVTYFNSATITADAVESVVEAAKENVPEGSSLTDLSLSLNVEDKGTTESTQEQVTTTTKTFEISLDQIVTVTDTASGNSTVTSSSVSNIPTYMSVLINVGKNLQNFKAYHTVDNVEHEMHTTAEEDTDNVGYYAYDSTTGIVTLYVKSFSPFSIKYDAKDYVARVIYGGSGVDYYSLQEAIDAAPVGSKVVLLADINLTETLETSNSFELDLNGKNISASDCRALFINEGIVSIVGKGIISANGTGLDADSSVIRLGSQNQVSNAAKLTIGTDVTVSSNKSYGVTVFGKNVDSSSVGQELVVYGKVTVTGTEAAISGNGSLWLSKTTITINEGAVVSSTGVDTDNGAGPVAIYHPQGGTLTVNGGTITGSGTGIEVEAGSVVIKGGEIKTTYSGDAGVKSGTKDGPATYGYSVVAVKRNYPYGPANVSITGGTIKGAVGVVSFNGGTDNAVLEITGGTFDSNPTEYVAEGYVAIENPEGTWTVNGPYVASTTHIDETVPYAYYDSLQDAINAAEEGDTVTLLKNIILTESVEIDNTRDLGLNLDGKTINIDSSKYAINNYGTVSIFDDIDNNETKGSIYARGIQNYGVMTVSDISVNATATNGGAVFLMEVKEGGAEKPSLDIRSGNFASARSAFVQNNGGDLTIGLSDCSNETVSYTANSASGYCICSFYGASSTVNCMKVRGTVNGVFYTQDSSSLVVKNADVDVQTPTNGYNLFMINYDCSVTVSGGSFVLTRNGNSFYQQLFAFGHGPYTEGDKGSTLRIIGNPEFHFDVPEETTFDKEFVVMNSASTDAEHPTKLIIEGGIFESNFKPDFLVYYNNNVRTDSGRHFEFYISGGSYRLRNAIGTRDIREIDSSKYESIIDSQTGRYIVQSK